MKQEEAIMVNSLSKIARNSSLLAVLAILLSVIAILRIISTYHIFNQTVDEPAHFSSGLEWLDRGSNLYGPDHPPLASVVAAVGPYLSGVRLTDAQRKSLDEREKGIFQKGWGYQQFNVGTKLFEQNGQYFRNLSLARSGILIFFIITIVVTWLWARCLFGSNVAIFAVLLLSTSPQILAHAGLVTNDMALTAFVFAGLFAFVTWVERPTIFHSLLLGVTWGLAALSKFSALLFLPACAAVVLVWRYIFFKRIGHTSPTAISGKFSRTGKAGVAAFCAFIVVWSGYRFTLYPLTTPELRPHETIDNIFDREGALHDLAYTVAESTPLPLLDFFRGVWIQKEHNDRGHNAYLLGDYSRRGWWYYFPTVFSVKTPIAFMVFVIIGSVASVLTTLRNKHWQPLAPMLCAVTIMIVVMPSNINIGSRYILPVYPLLAITAAFGVAYLWRLERKRLVARVATLTLLGWHLTSTTLAHPDYLGYFNEFAGSSPERIVADSDIDWGQDLYRLSTEVKRRNISELRLVYYGNPQLTELFGLTRTRPLAPYEQCQGWVAIDVYMLKGVHLSPPHDGYAWLEKYKPVASIGTSIKLYYIASQD
jgi:4-amino-4-deoxy-L-arabinose transferase-like glycosyltransferase